MTGNPPAPTSTTSVNDSGNEMITKKINNYSATDFPNNTSTVATVGSKDTLVNPLYEEFNRGFMYAVRSLLTLNRQRESTKKKK